MTLKWILFWIETGSFNTEFMKTNVLMNTATNRNLMPGGYSIKSIKTMNETEHVPRTLIANYVKTRVKQKYCFYEENTGRP